MDERIEFKKIFNGSDSKEIYECLLKKNIEYHKPYKRFNRIVKVPRGQASYTLNKNIHYNYGVSGGSPKNEVMCDILKAITIKVNEGLNTNYNTILMNVYKTGDDCIGFHSDNEKGWVRGSGFTTLAFGAVRDFQLRKHDTKLITTISHLEGYAIHMPFPLNNEFTHSVPKRKRSTGCRISLTFREISTAQPTA